MCNFGCTHFLMFNNISKNYTMCTFYKMCTFLTNYIKVMCNPRIDKGLSGLSVTTNKSLKLTQSKTNGS